MPHGSTKSAPRRRVPFTLVLGVMVIAVAEALLFTDVMLTPRGAVHTAAASAEILSRPPGSFVGDLARLVAVNITPIAWAGYLIALDGLLSVQKSGSPVRRRPHHFALLCFASVFIWCVFDYVNFHQGMSAWVYIGMPVRFEDKYVPYLLAFGSVVPGMLMSGQVMLNWRWFDWARVGSRSTPVPRDSEESDVSVTNPSLRSPSEPASKTVRTASILIGLAMLIWPLVYPNPITNLTLWTSFVFLLDPINDRFGRPSMFRDWRSGWYGRTLAAFAGGLVCGFLWEFWNYWALSKWTYDLPFLGSWGRHHYFEMPLPGLLGFMPFGLECWVMWQTIRIPLDGLAEPLPDDSTLL